jgi:hypothetical protein
MNFITNILTDQVPKKVVLFFQLGKTKKFAIIKIMSGDSERKGARRALFIHRGSATGRLGLARLPDQEAQRRRALETGDYPGSAIRTDNALEELARCGIFPGQTEDSNSSD